MLASLALGFGAGVLARRGRSEVQTGEGRSRDHAPSTPKPAGARSTPPDPVAEVPPRAIDPPPVRPPPLSPEALRERVEALRAAATRAAAEGDGRTVLGIIRQLALLGEAGFGAAAEMLDRVLADVDGDWPTLGISDDDLSSLLLIPEMGPFEAWLVSDPARGSSAARAAAAHYLAYSPDMDPFPVLLAALLKETDAAVARRLAAGMRTATAKDLPALMEAALAQAGRESSGSTIAVWMGRRGGAEALPYLRKLQESTDPAMAEEAMVQARLLAPPTPGALVTGLPQAAATELRRGDIVVSWDGAPVETAKQLTYRMARMPAGSKATLLVHRGDAIVPVTLENRPDGIGARTVGGKK